MAQDQFDYVVVGGGTAGAALAARLAEAPGRTVCLIEAGGRDTHPFIHVPAGVAAAISTKTLNWRFETVAAAGHERAAHPGATRARCWGGSGSINGMVYFRGHPTDFRRLGRSGRHGVELCRSAALFHAHRE